MQRVRFFDRISEKLRHFFFNVWNALSLCSSPKLSAQLELRKAYQDLIWKCFYWYQVVLNWLLLKNPSFIQLLQLRTGLPVFLDTICPNGGKYTKVPQHYQYFPFYGPPKFTPIKIFGLKIYHLATPVAKGKRQKCLTRFLFCFTFQLILDPLLKLIWLSPPFSSFLKIWFDFRWFLLTENETL
jgi:hypothetical protein